MCTINDNVVQGCLHESYCIKYLGQEIPYSSKSCHGEISTVAFIGTSWQVDVVTFEGSGISRCGEILRKYGTHDLWYLQTK